MINFVLINVYPHSKLPAYSRYLGHSNDRNLFGICKDESMYYTKEFYTCGIKKILVNITRKVILYLKT